MRKFVVLLVGVFAAAAFWAMPAFAQEGSGYIEICKTAPAGAAVPASNAVFDFYVNDSEEAVSVRVGTCSEPIEVPAGEATIEEDLTTGSFEISKITVRDGEGAVTTPTIENPLTVDVAAGGIDNETVVTYENRLVTGLVEICKSALPNSGVTGSFTFDLTPADARAGSVASVTVPVGQCSNPFAVPAGEINVAEHGVNFVTSITATQNGGNALVDYDLGEAWADVNVVAGSDVRAETLVRFTNSLSMVKLCKSTNLVGNFAFAITTPAGTTNASLAGGECTLPMGIAPGAQVTITETPVPGTAVSAIYWNDIAQNNPTPANLQNRSITFTAQGGANVITFVNVAAGNVPVKVCKAAGAAGTWSFDVNGVAHSITVDAAGGCTDLLGPYPYDTTLAITETNGTPSSMAVTGNARLVSTSGATITVLAGLWYPAAGTTGPIAVVTFTNAAAVAPTTPTTPSTPSTPSGGGSAAPQGVAAAGGSVASAAKADSLTSAVPAAAPAKTVVAKKAASLKSAKMVQAKLHGKLMGYRWLIVRVNSASNVQRIRIALQTKDKLGHLRTHVVFRTVKTNRAFKVANLKIGAAVKTVRVGIAA